ncbi:hypothetical protein AAHC03_026583 [Spirometra sp. Aus1]
MAEKSIEGAVLACVRISSWRSRLGGRVLYPRLSNGLIQMPKWTPAISLRRRLLADFLFSQKQSIAVCTLL